MIKLTFKEVQKIKDVKEQFQFECLFIVCFGILQYQAFEVTRIQTEEFNDNFYFINTNNIKSIEHVKPTEL